VLKQRDGVCVTIALLLVFVNWLDIRLETVALKIRKTRDQLDALART